MNITENIKKRIKEHGYSVSAVAEQLNVLPQQLSRTINNPNIRLTDLEQIANVINCDVADFLFADATSISSIHLCPHCNKPIRIHLDK